MIERTQSPILVADDDQDILLYFQGIFKKTSNKLYFSPNGLDALEKARKYKIELAFIDVLMPKMNGLETLIEWKTIQPETQIVIISAYSDDKLVKEAIKNGAYSYLFKPLNQRDIFSVTLKCLTKASVEESFQK